MPQKKDMSPQKKAVLNGLFLLTCVVIVFFLFSAPEETTPKLPHDANHESLYGIKSKKEAEKHCASCHAPGKSAPLSATHPPEYRCLFCHQRK